MEEARAAMLALGFTEGEKPMPWRETLGYSDEELPGVFLAGARYREGMTQAELAGKTGIPGRHISEMEHVSGPSASRTPAIWPPPWRPGGPCGAGGQRYVSFRL